jgi:hypothetical protein
MCIASGALRIQLLRYIMKFITNANNLFFEYNVQHLVSCNQQMYGANTYFT